MLPPQSRCRILIRLYYLLAAMDGQAQVRQRFCLSFLSHTRSNGLLPVIQNKDRAHRIGQTREVHIFRLIIEHAIEEYLLLKAKQKKNPDKLVKDEGYFDAIDASIFPVATKT